MGWSASTTTRCADRMACGSWRSVRWDAWCARPVPPRPSRRSRGARSPPPSTWTCSVTWRGSSRRASAAPCSRSIPTAGRFSRCTAHRATTRTPSWAASIPTTGVPSTRARHPLLDRAIKTFYPPGSTWKLAIATMALRRGIVTLRSHMPIPCRGGLQYGNRFFRCWSARGHGDLTLTDAIAQSCDVYFYQLGLKVGLTSLLEDASGLGFRSRTGIDLPGEITAVFPGGTDYYDRVYGPRRWTSAVTLNLAIGQGENAQTLVNMVRFYQMLASDGRARPPYLVHPAAGSGATLGLLPEQLAGLRQAMISVVERGTARGAGRFGGSIAIAGKSGTAQNSHGPDHGWFIGFAPAEKPEIVVGAIIEFAQHGTAVAPLVARTIAHYLGIDEHSTTI